jgi:hypothetical protein
VSRKEVAAVLKSILLRDGVFPIEEREGVVYEGAILGLVASGAQIARSRAYASDPKTAAERRIDRYQEVDAAIEAFIDMEWSAGIDGISWKTEG